MDPTERARLYDSRTETLLKSFEAHALDVADFALTHNIDIDVVTDITPTIEDVTDPGAHQALAFYKSMYDAIDSHHRFLTISRFVVEPINSYVKSYPPVRNMHVASMWIRVFMDPTPDSIRFIKGDGQTSHSRMQLYGSSVLATGDYFDKYDTDEPVTILSADSAMKLTGDAVNSELMAGYPIVTSSESIPPDFHSIIDSNWSELIKRHGDDLIKYTDWNPDYHRWRQEVIGAETSQP